MENNGIPNFETDVPGVLVLVTGKDNQGQPHYAYATVPYENLSAFAEAQRTGTLDINQFGTVRYHGQGAEPSEDVKKEMEAKFGAVHDLTKFLNNQHQLASITPSSKFADLLDKKDRSDYSLSV